MRQTTSRRTFLAAAAATAAAAGLRAASSGPAADSPAAGPATAPATGPTTGPTTAPADGGPPFRATLHRAMIIGAVDENALTRLKDAGFEGVESTAIVPEADAAKARGVADRLGMRVHSVLRGWAEFNSTDPAKVAESVATTEAALHAAAGYGADAVLTVPCRIGGMPMPEPWEFNIEFDEKTGHVTKVVDGGNGKYKAYIDAHNRAVDTSTEAVKRLIPVAEKAKVVIGLENVWNNLWVKPTIYRHFVASFGSPWVKAYFDIGNHVKYGPPPQDWVRTLGDLVVKCHVKDWRFAGADHHKGGFVHPRDGHIDWPAVRRALDDVGYNGWLTIEDGGLPLKEFGRRIDLIVAGR